MDPHFARLRNAATLSVAALSLACASNQPASSPGATPAPAAAPSTPAAPINPNSLAARPPKSGSVGEAVGFAIKVSGLGYGPDRATYQLTHASYVTIVAVTDSGIRAIAPLREFPSKLEGGGMHTASLFATEKGDRVADRFGATTVVDRDDPNAAAAEAAYNRCLLAAAASDRKKAATQAPIIGYDDKGKPIYGPPPVVPASDGSPDAERMCEQRYTRRGNATGGGPYAAQQAGKLAKSGRYLMMYASDTPIEYRDIEQLAVSETDPELIALSIGRKLFASRGAQWAGYFIPW